MILVIKKVKKIKKNVKMGDGWSDSGDKSQILLVALDPHALVEKDGSGMARLRKTLTNH